MILENSHVQWEIHLHSWWMLPEKVGGLEPPNPREVHVPYEAPWSADWLVPNDLVLQVTARRESRC